jgi:hypothetical protein
MVKEGAGWLGGVEVDEFNIALRVVVIASDSSFARAYLNPLQRSTGQGMLAVRGRREMARGYEVMRLCGCVHVGEVMLGARGKRVEGRE